MTDWSKSILEWQEGNIVYLSVVFTWDLPEARKRALQARMLGLEVKAGGPAVKLMPDYLTDVAECNGSPPPGLSPLKRHNPCATFTSRGCIRNCQFCAVPKLEGKLRELDDWKPAPLVCDNNLLACSRVHFDRVIDRLAPFKGQVDFNQGLDARLLTQYHADRLSELKPMARLAFDSTAYESLFMRAYERLRKASFPKKNIHVYVLIGFRDTPEDALYRLRLVRSLSIKPNPMRFQALDSLQKNSYVGPNWTHSELSRYMRYWANLRFTEGVPFEEWDGQKHPQPNPAQMVLL